MKRSSAYSQTGFTLVELAIVLVIIGLLIAGVLRGQELMANARITSTIQQAKSYTGAVHTFFDKYNGLPGDLMNAGARIPNCTGNCAWFGAGVGSSLIAATGDGIVGKVFIDKVGTPTYSGTTFAMETTNFWLHLALAHLITGVNTNNAGTSANTAWQNVYPAAKIGGYFNIRFFTIPATGGVPPVTGHYFLLLPSDVADSSALTLIRGTPGQSVTSPKRAAQLDRKTDDGLPLTGSVLSVGTTSCEGTASANAYDETSEAMDCNLLIAM